MTPRRPRSATSTTTIPTLAIGSSLFAAGCAEPVCGSTRADELSAHAAAMQRAADQSRPGDVLREFATATGLRAHPSLPEPETRTGGVPAPVDPVPPPQRVDPPPAPSVPDPPRMPLGRVAVHHVEPPTPSAPPTHHVPRTR